MHHCISFLTLPTSMIWEYTQPSKHWQHYFAKAGRARIKKDVKLILDCQAGYSRFSGKLLA